METTVQNPDEVIQCEVDDRGRINLGVEYAGDTVKLAVGVIEESDEEGGNTPEQ